MKSTITAQKLRGGYYTPPLLAAFLAKWVIQSSTKEILEPSCGDGVLLQAAFDELLKHALSPAQAACQLTGVEYDPVEAKKALERFGEERPEVEVGDFFSYCHVWLEASRRFDAILGNPPYIRFQNFPEEHRLPAFKLMRDAGMHPNRLMNVWVPFLVGATQLLREGGRLGMVIPAELLQISYARELRQFLCHSYRKITLLTFKKLVFAGIQQEVVLFLGERGGDQQATLAVIEVEDGDALASFSDQAHFHGGATCDYSAHEKWTMYLLEPREIHFLRALASSTDLVPSGDVLEVDVGVTTGMNNFFVLSKEQVVQYELDAYMQRLVGRSKHLQGIQFSEQDWCEAVEANFSVFLFQPPHIPFHHLPPALQTYVALGEGNGWHTGYKCRIRTPWYKLPSTWIPHAFLLRQIHSYPKLIQNSAQATCTDTLHRIRFRNEASATRVITGFMNVLTFTFSELLGRSYGGGVLELEPSEAERLPLPLKNIDALDMQQIDALVRQNSLDQVLAITDEVLLKQGMGLSTAEIKTLRSIWEKLRMRRMIRK